MNRKVLIVDDEENIRMMARIALEADGYQVGEAVSGMETFALLGHDASWDAIILDQKMPGLLGTDVLRRIKVMAPEARVIMMTAFASVDLAVETMKLGATDFIRKPMTPEVLRGAVKAALSKDAEASEQPLSGSTEHPALHRPTITMNGFTILHPAEDVEAMQQNPNERRFIVRSPDRQEHEIVVEIDSEAIEAVERVTPRLPLENSFWTEQAERFLSDFIWNDGQVPVTGRLLLKGVERAKLETVARKEALHE
jgi:DNA-binding response OmpR family regulator